MKKITKILCVLLALVVFCSCATTPPKAESAAPAAPAPAAQPESAAPAPAPAQDQGYSTKDLVIGLQNGIAGTSWRTIMVNDFKDVAEQYKAEGRIKDYIISQNVTNSDVNEQISQVRDMIAKGVDIILINPNSLDALDGVYEEARDAGTTIIVIGAPYDSDKTLTVCIDYYEWYKAYLDWVVEASGGTGNAIAITGPDSHPANLRHIDAMNDIIPKTNIKILASGSGNWNQTGAKEVTASLLASYPDIDISLNQDSMGDGVLSAFLDANRLPKYMFGDMGPAFYKKWKELREQNADIKIFSQPKPPGISATALKLAVRLAEGKEFKDGLLGGGKGHTYYYPVSTRITDENFEEGWELLKDMPGDYQFSEYLTEEQADACFK